MHLGTTGRSAPIFKVFEKHPKPGETLATRELPFPLEPANVGQRGRAS